MDDEVWKWKSSFLAIYKLQPSLIVSTVNACNFRSLIGKQLLEKSTLFARWRVTHRERESSNRLSRRNPQHRSSKKMAKTLPLSTTSMPRQPKPGYIRVQLLFPYTFVHTWRVLINHLLEFALQLMFLSVTINLILPSPHSSPTHWWPCQRDLAKHSLLQLSCITTSDGFLKVISCAALSYVTTSLTLSTPLTHPFNR